MSSENPTWASQPLTVVLHFPGPQALLRFAQKSRRGGNEGPRNVASTCAPAATSPAIATPTDPAIPFGTANAAGVTVIIWPVTR